MQSFINIGGDLVWEDTAWHKLFGQLYHLNHFSDDGQQNELVKQKFIKGTLPFDNLADLILDELRAIVHFCKVPEIKNHGT